MEPPHPYWADHDHSDEHLNLLFTAYPQETEPPPPHPYWADHDRSDEHLNLVYPTVRQQRLFYPPSPDDSGYFSPSETQFRARRRKLRVVNTTPPPPSPPPPPATTTPLLFAEEEQEEAENQDFLNWRTVKQQFSSEWSASSSADSTSTIMLRVKTKEKKKKKEKRAREHSPAKHVNNNICTRGLRRAARKCICPKVLAVKRKTMMKFSPRPPGSMGADSGYHFGLGIQNRGADGAMEEENPKAGGKKEGVCDTRMQGRVRAGVLERIKRTLLRKKGPVELKRAEVRFPLD